MKQDLERALLQALAQEWRRLNIQVLRESLRPPAFVLVDSTTFLGQWERRVRVIRMARSFVTTQPWGVVVEVLKHEVAHQYAHEVLHATTETAHGPAFREVCARFGFDASASGLPADVHGDDRVVRRIQKLLALAQSPEPAEAHAAMAAAQRLMLEHNLSHTPPGYTWRHLGPPHVRIPAYTQTIGAILLEFFFVEAIWVPIFDVAAAREARVLEICGTPENVELAAYVWDFLHAAGERLWDAHRRRGLAAGQTERKRYITGVMEGFYQKQKDSQRKNEAEGLVWVGDPRLDDWYDRRHPHRRARRSTSLVANDAYHAGKAQGRELVLHRPVTGAAGNRGHLLE